MVVSASAAVEDPAVKLGKTLDALLDVLYDNNCVDDQSDSKQNKIRQILKGSYDLTVLVRYVAGPNWKRFQPDEQERFVHLVEGLAIKTCVNELKGKIRPVIQLNKTRRQGNRAEVLFSLVLDGNLMNGIFRFARRANGWQIYDIVMENISFGKNYRQQLNDHFRTKTTGELIEKLEEMIMLGENEGISF